MKSVLLFLNTAIFMMLLFLSGCSSSDNSAPSQSTDLGTDYLVRAWKEFENKRYDAATLLFADALTNASSDSVKADAYCGRGWSALLNRKLPNALTEFGKALNTSKIPEAIKIDVSAGKSYAQFAMKDFSGTITTALEVVTVRQSYSFSHAPTVTAKQLRLLLAQSYFATGQFYQAAQQMDLVNPQQAPHSSDPTILLSKITSLVGTM